VQQKYKFFLYSCTVCF